MANNGLHPVWTQEQKEWLFENLDNYTNEDLVNEFEKKFGFRRTKCAIEHMYEKYGKLKKNDGKFKKNNTPFNKGLPTASWITNPDSVAKCKANQFKKGHKSQNYVPVGTLTTKMKTNNKYWWIKIKDDDRAKDNWILFHRYVWEQFNGKIPEGMRIIFKDGNPNNVDLPNLMMVSKEEIGASNRLKLRSEFGEITEASINIYRLKKVIEEYENDI